MYSWHQLNCFPALQMFSFVTAVMQNKNTGERETPAALPERETPATLIHSSPLQDNRTLLQLSMNSSALLLLVGLMGAACSPVTSCPEGCSKATYTHQNFKVLSNLQNNSVAPWDLKEDKVHGREPETILYASCKSCINGLIAIPIYVQIYVYQTVWVGDNQQWCRCPFELAVGCTCVNK